jgi:hypothetical protein
VPRNRRANTTLLSRMSLEGMGPSLAVENASTREVFEAFAKIRGILRRAGALTRDALVEALGVAISAVRVQDAQGFFKHCGYGAL